MFLHYLTEYQTLGYIIIFLGMMIEGDIIAIILWVFIVGGLGYLSSASFILIKHYLRYTELTLFFGLILFILISHLISHISKKKI